MPRYRCSLKGQCEEDNTGYYTREECVARCHAPFDRLEYDLQMEVLMYTPETVLTGAKSDQAEVLRRLTGIVIPANRFAYVTNTLIYALSDNYGKLYSITRYPPTVKTQADDYFSQRLDELDYLMLEHCYESNTIQASSNWKSARLQMEVALRDLFGESEEIEQAMFEELEDDDSLPTTIEELEKILIYRVDSILREVFTIDWNQSMELEPINKYWPYIVETFGPTIPFQHRIRAE